MYMFTLNIAEFKCSLLLQIMSAFGFNCCQCYVHNKQGAGKKKLFLRKTSNKLSFNELYSLFLKFSALGLLQDIRNNFHS